jgi:hypothetical protein
LIFPIKATESDLIFAPRTVESKPTFVVKLVKELERLAELVA